MQEIPRAAASLPYHEPGIKTILIQSTFLLLLNIANYILDRAVYCGLLGQVFLGVAWGTPGAKWLGVEAEHVILQLGYLGLLLLVYEGGLSTSLHSLKANILLSVGVAITGISLPIGLSFILRDLIRATPIQCFAAGAALCSTSLGTTFTVLGSSGLIKSRLGVVLTSAAMMDDVVGLVMVQVISNLGQSSTNISAAVVVRPLLVSLAFGVVSPLVCVAIAKPATLWLNSRRAQNPRGHLNRTLQTHQAAFFLHTSILLGCTTAATYAGTSNLFAAYIAGASITWWDLEVPHSIDYGSSQNPNIPPEGDVSEATRRHERDGSTSPSGSTSENDFPIAPSGVEVYEMYYLAPVNRILRPLFFASIGFSIPITEMFSRSIVWRGIIYTVLMTIGKVACGVWLLRLSLKSSIISRLKAQLLRLPRPGLKHFWGRKSEEQASTTQEQAQELSIRTPTPEASSAPPRASLARSEPAVAHSHTTTASTKPRSVYPAAIIGCAMTARGEIGFLISSIAESNGIFMSDSDRGTSSDIFLVVTWAIVLCTILGPLAVGLVVQRVKKLQRGVEKDGRVIREDVLGVWGLS
ncbi:hypothetical protein QQS21_007576 [Conoideocrella luteorostrata]|uniref:Cation/H+ exchanger transmembrane domain-containing protein n=1 Tax=Conoideocrella luteorostrata TaxID=1105319 RepID=A0AAJ0CPU5_9HYPO|nr:hypothetical protein QQS21_007576 [Conoideocrella luteorostrata]